MMKQNINLYVCILVLDKLFESIRANGKHINCMHGYVLGAHVRMYVESWSIVSREVLSLSQESASSKATS